MLSQLSSLNSVTRTRPWCFSSQLSMNRSLIAAVATWSCSVVKLTRKSLVVRLLIGNQHMCSWYLSYLFFSNWVILPEKHLYWELQHHVWTRYMWVHHQKSPCHFLSQWIEPFDQEKCSLWDWSADSCLHSDRPPRCYIQHSYWQQWEKVREFIHWLGHSPTKENHWS